MTSSPETMQKPQKTTIFGKARAYLALTKPRVIELLLITTVPTMILAQRGLPDIWLVLATLVGGAMSAGSANAFNCYIDADIDKVMDRTSKRPLVTGALSKTEALIFAYAIGAGSVLWLGLLVNWLAAALSLAAILFYVLIYTMLLKRRTPQNIVWGGAAGAMPVLIGWAAVTNDLSPAAWILFLIIFLWTPRTIGRSLCATKTTTPPPVFRCFRLCATQKQLPFKSFSTRGRWWLRASC
jgi:heme o synthase